MVAARRRKHWGWGFEDEQPSHAAVIPFGGGTRVHPAGVLNPGVLIDP